ncbi:helix-turn-helix domain-containing protein [Aestuariibaculum sp. YM273]|uniref:helix-turn-helix domain-containing protein n=1 Tax=Aestuariibaculum sp. YM273 TaxID=3070659 RepID=UPI0027DAED06|nr:helix-turn-helix domain-containing protein [Aestuariibaculum sp. YM273]WMI64109.1 helix-turn-helix domain-containing protein [Aestuariibaculum sp. YM273]
MEQKNSFTLTNPQTGNLAFKLHFFDKDNPFDHVQRLNYYSLIWVKNGQGTVKADFLEHDFGPDSLFSFSLYQPFMLNVNGNISGLAIHFHPDFFCIHKHQKEVACNGVLFNNMYDPPFIQLDDNAKTNFDLIINQIKTEMQNPALAQYELLISYLKIFLITASRLKTEQQDQNEQINDKTEEPFILQNLKNYIETHYKTKHTASDYADMLAITPKALSKLTKSHFNKTLTELISERIIIEAKRELYLTNKTVKEIAYNLGYNDEYYFSRFFKKNVEVSPLFFRESIGFDKSTMN